VTTNGFAEAATKLAAAIEVEAKKAAGQPEEQLRIGIERRLAPACEQLGLTVSGTYETRIQSKRADAVYGAVIIEYERSGSFAKPAVKAHALKQLREDYLVGSAKSAQDGAVSVEALRRYIGVALDGTRIVFVRHTTAAEPEKDLPGIYDPATGSVTYEVVQGVPGTFQQIEFPVSPASVATLLTYMRALSRRLMTADTLAKRFGPGTTVAETLVPVLVERLTTPKSDHVATFFAGWRAVFDVVYGGATWRAEDAGALAALYGVKKNTDVPVLLFAVHTYFALLAKIIAIELLSLQGGSIVASFAVAAAGRDDAALKDHLDALEKGEPFTALGIENYLEGDFLSWYLAVWSAELANAVRLLLTELTVFEPATPTLQPEGSQDLLKSLYQKLVPRDLRHKLGEFYTPDWLAQHLIEVAGYDGDPNKTLIDPACGTGTFLIEALNLARAHAARNLVGNAELARSVLDNIVGFDLNPLAVIAARTNFLLFLGDLRRYVNHIRLPIYLCDAVLIPTEHAKGLAGGVGAKPKRDFFVVPSSVAGVGDFKLPVECRDRTVLEGLIAAVDKARLREEDTSDFRQRASRLKTLSPTGVDIASELYDHIEALTKKDKDGIWIQFIRNQFAPLLCKPADYVVGNPPWVEWEDLPDSWRARSQELWFKYGLFTLKGPRASLGGAKKDLSMLFTYVAADRYLKPGGTLAFLITQTVFQSPVTAEGFRRFQLGATGDNLSVTHADDFVAVKPFEDASNRTAAFVMIKGAKTMYPVPYVVWRRKAGRVPVNAKRAAAFAALVATQKQAQPSDPARTNSPWEIAEPGAAPMASAGKTVYYRPRTGLTTWLDGVYRVKAKRRPDGLLDIVNRPDVGKTTGLKRVTSQIESSLVFPYVPQSGLERFRSRAEDYVIVPQDPQSRQGYDEKSFAITHPETYDYLKRFRSQLIKRSGYQRYFKKFKAPFYSVFDFDENSLAPFRVAWRAFGNTDIRAAILREIDDPNVGRRAPQTKNTTKYVVCGTEAEALYVCGMLNAPGTTQRVRSASVSGGKGFGGNLLDLVQIPRFVGSSAQDKVVGFGRLAERALARNISAALDLKALDKLAEAVWAEGEIPDAPLFADYAAPLGQPARVAKRQTVNEKLWER
jgi:hypothetical protein